MFLLLETMQERGVETDLYTLNSVLKACGSSGQVERECKTTICATGAFQEACLRVLAGGGSSIAFCRGLTE